MIVNGRETEMERIGLLHTIGVIRLIKRVGGVNYEIVVAPVKRGPGTTCLIHLVSIAHLLRVETGHAKGSIGLLVLI